MAKVLWISRHEMTPAQREDLERVMRAPVTLIPWKDTVEDIAELLPALRQADAAAAVLPPEKLSALLQAADGKPVLQAVSGRAPTGRTVISANGTPEPEFAFVHLYWERILKLELRTRRL